MNYHRNQRFVLRTAIILSLAVFLPVSFGQSSIPANSDSGSAVIHHPAPADTLLELRRLETGAGMYIERLTVDIDVLVKEWENARSTAAAHKEGRVSGSLRSQAFWQQLNTMRIELANYRLRKEFLERARHIGTECRTGSAEAGRNPDILRWAIDSSRVLITRVESECSWIEERVREAGFELKALGHSGLQPDSSEAENEKWLDFRREALGRQIEIDSLFVDWSLTFLLPRLMAFQNSANDALERMTFTQKAHFLLRRIAAVWNYELRRFDGASLTVGNIITAILLILIGINIAQRLSRVIARIIQKRYHMEPGVVDAGRKLFFYAFSVVFVTAALHTVQIPLTAFTVAGGALALGVGFGSQNILNNFISGIILLAERPIKTGDFVEVEGAIGSVESIGLRSTRIRTPGNVHLVLPNSSFLEKNVLNWTLADHLVRLEVQVGVMYGSPVRDVKRLLLAAVADNDRIHKKPEPIVLFSDFGDSALIFDLLFWIQIDNIIDRRTIKSALRFKINDLFAQAGIVIAFPQRDIHLEAPSGIKVIVEKDPGSSQDHAQA